MSRAQFNRLCKLPDQSEDRQLNPQKQNADQWNRKFQDTDQISKSHRGVLAYDGRKDNDKLSNGIPTTDGHNDEDAKPPNDPSAITANDEPHSHHLCHHCHHGNEKDKEVSISVESRPKELVVVDTRSREDIVVRSIRPVPITLQRKPFIARPDSKLRHAGTARAYTAATEEHPNGTTHRDWARVHSHQTVLQQHCAFFDPDHDGIIWPRDTFSGFYKLGFGLILSSLAVVLIHAAFSYPTLSTWIPDPFLRIYIANIHKDKHGSDSGTYDHEGRFVPQAFEDIFEKYATGRDFVTIWDVGRLVMGQKCLADPVGSSGALLEWLTTWLLLWPNDGRMTKEDVRGVFDGSVFYKIAARRASDRAYGYEWDAWR
ncbi:hypothetical protein N0V90_010489 [Kalmusia sp. IMI 367209]|nr:hypothetical protein N0V90_010489 [Kalmusia sp. IMI 367209]